MSERARRWGWVGNGLALVGGIAAVVGVLLPWGTGTARFVGGELFGYQLPPPLAGVAGAAPRSLSFTGTSDWTGFLAMGAGLCLAAAVLVGAMAPNGRGWWPVVAGIAGALAVAAAVQAAIDMDRIARDAFLAPVYQEADRLGGFLGLVPGLLDRLIEEFGNLFEFDARPGIGLVVTGVGGVLAVASVATGQLGGRPRHARLQHVLARWTPDARADLQAALQSQPEVRREMVARFRDRPDRRGLAELLDELERDDAARTAIERALEEWPYSTVKAVRMPSV